MASWADLGAFVARLPGAVLVLESYLVRGGPRRLGGLDPESILPGRHG